MFMEIQEPFDRVCPKNRKNFFSYNYILYKFCELLGEKEHMSLFTLLKSREKLYQQDCIWKEICAITKWPFTKVFEKNFFVYLLYMLKFKKGEITLPQVVVGLMIIFSCLPCSLLNNKKKST